MIAAQRNLTGCSLGFALILILISIAVASPPLTREVVVFEIAWMGTTVSANDEWIELYNTAAPINLTGWTLIAADGPPTITLEGTIPAHGYYLLERTDDTTVPAVAADRIYAGALDNAGEDLLLRDDSSGAHQQRHGKRNNENVARVFAAQVVLHLVRPDGPGESIRSGTT